MVVYAAARPPLRHAVGARRPDPAGDPGAADAGRGDGGRAGGAVRHVGAGGLQAPAGAGARRADPARPRRAAPPVPARTRPAERSRRLPRRFPPVLGRHGRPPRGLPARASEEGLTPMPNADTVAAGVEPEADREIVIERLLDAPRELVFEVFTSAEHLGRWWGPTGFSVTTSAFDFRVGGVWRFVMHGPDGRDYQNRLVFDVIDRPARLLARHGG